MKEIGSYFNVSFKNKKAVFTATRGKFKDISIRFNNAKITEELKDGGAIMTIDYTVTKNPQGIDVAKSALEKYFGQFILHIMEEQMKREDKA